MKIGSGRFSDLAPGQSAVVSVKLSRSARRALRKAEGFKVKARASDGNGNVATTSRSFDV